MAPYLVLAVHTLLHSALMKWQAPNSLTSDSVSLGPGRALRHTCGHPEGPGQTPTQAALCNVHECCPLCPGEKQSPLLES